MKETKIYHIVEYSSLIFILSYFIAHNIFLVLIGIIISLFLININLFDSFIRSENKNKFIKNVSSELSKNEKVEKLNSITIKPESINQKSYKEDSQLTLVETIEELGFIPSMNGKSDSNVA